jgi:hypothetical protein
MLCSNQWPAKKGGGGRSPVTPKLYHRFNQQSLFLPELFYAYEDIQYGDRINTKRRGSVISKKSKRPFCVILTSPPPPVNLIAFQRVIKPILRGQCHCWPREPGFTSSLTVWLTARPFSPTYLSTTSTISPSVLNLISLSKQCFFSSPLTLPRKISGAGLWCNKRKANYSQTPIAWRSNMEV